MDETKKKEKEMKNKATTKTLLWKVWRRLSCVQSCDLQVGRYESTKGEVICHICILEKHGTKTRQCSEVGGGCEFGLHSRRRPPLVTTEPRTCCTEKH